MTRTSPWMCFVSEFRAFIRCMSIFVVFQFSENVVVKKQSSNTLLDQLKQEKKKEIIRRQSVAVGKMNSGNFFNLAWLGITQVNSCLKRV